MKLILQRALIVIALAALVAALSLDERQRPWMEAVTR